MAIIPFISIFVSKLVIFVHHKIKDEKITLRGINKKSIQYLFAIILMLFFANQVGGNFYLLWKHRDNDYQYFIDQIKATIPDNKKIWGASDFWIGLKDYQYLTPSSPYKEVEKFKPDFVILYDSSIWGTRSSTVGRKDETGHGYLYIRKKMESLCSNKGTIVKKINNDFYGNIHICKIDWE
jgi:hypothetical protein